MVSEGYRQTFAMIGCLLIALQLTFTIRYAVKKNEMAWAYIDFGACGFVVTSYYFWEFVVMSEETYAKYLNLIKCPSFVLDWLSLNFPSVVAPAAASTSPSPADHDAFSEARTMDVDASVLMLVFIILSSII